MFFSLFSSLFLSYFFNFPLSTLISLSSSVWLSFRLITLSSHPSPFRSQSADSGSTYMMNWAGTLAAQVPPRVHGDTTRGELSCAAVIYDTLCMHTWNSLHRLKWVNSLTAASNMISQCFIYNVRTVQDKNWSRSGEASALKHVWRIVSHMQFEQD